MDNKELAKDAPATAAVPAPEMTPETKPEPKPLPKVRVNAICARIAATCMARTDIRYYLNGLLVEPRPEGGVVIVGTDGHRLCAVIDKDGEASEPVILRVQDIVQHLPKPKDEHKSLDGQRMGEFALVLESLRGKPVLVMQDGSGRMLRLSGDAIVEGKFPDWRRSVLSRPWADLKPQCLDIYNPDYLHETDILLRGKGCLRFAPLPYQADQGSVILWHFVTQPNVLLAVMPMVADRHARADKDWITNFWPATKTEPKAEKAKDATPA